MKIRVFELAKTKNISIARAAELLGQKGLKDVSAITFVEPTVLDDLGQELGKPEAGPGHEERSRQTEVPRISRDSERRTLRAEPFPPTEERERPLAFLALVAGGGALLLAGYLFVSERSDRTEMKEMSAEINLLKAGNAKIEDIVISNRAQILDVRDQIVGMEKRLYEFKRSSLINQIKGEGVVLRALSENLKEPLRSKAQTLSNHLSTF